MLEGDGITTFAIKPIKSPADHCGMGRWEPGAALDMARLHIDGYI